MVFFFLRSHERDLKLNFCSHKKRKYFLKFFMKFTKKKMCTLSSTHVCGNRLYCGPHQHLLCWDQLSAAFREWVASKQAFF